LIKWFFRRLQDEENIDSLVTKKKRLEVREIKGVLVLKREDEIKVFYGRKIGEDE
jgi:hypothetical protein